MPYIWIKKLSRKQREREKVLGEIIDKIHSEIKSIPKISEGQGPQFLDPKAVEQQFVGKFEPVVASSEIKEVLQDHKVEVVNLETGEIKDASERKK
ncbi:MAG: hypothetical protein ACP5H3_03855 [Candidatus Aenigmatarchaeota archaeon]|jgi:hypothetical protein